MQNKISTKIGGDFIMSILAVMSLVSVSCGQVAMPEDVQVKTAVSIPKLVGVGILGDSNSDEYQADDHRGGAYAEHTLNWPEQLGRRRGVNFGKWGEWDEPPRQGYAYNWARSGATAASMIQSGQHTGLAAQVAAGDVSHVIIYIGTNDVNVHSGFYEAVYNQTKDETTLLQEIDQFVMNVTTAVDTIIAAGNTKIILVNVADPGLAPEVLQQFPEAYKRQRVTDAINLLNSRLQTMAEARDIPVVDLANVSLDILSLADNDGYLLLDGEKINILETGDEPHHLRLGDSSGHAGTVAAGLMANELFIKPLREIYGAAIEPLSALEILQNANLR